MIASIIIKICFAEYYQPLKPINIQPFRPPAVTLTAGSNSVFLCRGTAAGNNTSVTLRWATPVPQISDLPPANLSVSDPTQEMVDTYCQGKSKAFNLPPESELAPSDNTSLAPEGALVLHLRAGLLICGANPSLTNQYTCLATNNDSQVLHISIPSGVMSDAITAVVVIVLAALFFVVLIGWCCFLRYRSKLKKYDFVRMTQRSHIPSQRSRHSFTNHTFDRYPNDSPSDAERDSLEFSRDKLHFISVLGKFLA